MRDLVPGLCLLAAVAVASPVAAADPPCSAPEHRQFDFWLGSWEVTLPDGKPAGHNEITRVLGGCALSEHWLGNSGFEGYSLNGYDPATRQWHQTWVDSSGARLVLSGGLQGESMVMAGEDPPAAGAAHGVRHRITWTPNADGSVRQLWESSADGGATWTTAFDGTYRKASAPAAASAPETTAPRG